MEIKESMVAYPNAFHVSQVKARFYHMDLSGSVFFCNHLKWLDSIAFVEFLKEKDINWKQMQEEYGVDMALTNISFNYRAPIFLDDVVDVVINDVKLGNKSFRLSGSLYNHQNGQIVADGFMTYVFVNKKTQKSVSIPEGIKQKLL